MRLRRLSIVAVGPDVATLTNRFRLTLFQQLSVGGPRRNGLLVYDHLPVLITSRRQRKRAIAHYHSPLSVRLQLGRRRRTWRKKRRLVPVSR